jgi:RNA polymerase sigma factor (sigma-70 family)
MRTAASAMLGARWSGRHLSDERLVARVRAGDTRAFEQIYDRYSRSIHSFCRHLLGHPDDADDAVQHTFLAAYRAIRHSAQPIDLKPWLFAIARNRCISVLRARRHEPAVGGEGAAPEPATEGLLSAVELRESLRDLLRDISTLPEDQRSALILTQLGTLRHEEVARVLGVPTEKVKALVFQARNSLMSARHARETACQDIREQLATLTGGALRRGNLRRHLVSCDGCRDYQRALKRQRAAIVVLLPVVAQPVLRQKVLGEIAGGAAGAGAAGAGASGALGGLAANGVVLKVGIAATVAVTGVGVASFTGDVRRAFGDSDTPAVATLTKAPATNAPGSSSSIAAPPHPRPVALRVPVVSPRHTATKRKHSSAHHELANAPAHASDPVKQHTDNGGSAPSSSAPAAGATPPGLGKQDGTAPGQVKKQGRTHSPPGQAKKNGTHSPPGQVKKNGTNVPPGQVKKNPPASNKAPGGGSPPAAIPPGNANGNGNSNPSGHGNGGGNGNAGGNGNSGGNGNAGGSGNAGGNGNPGGNGNSGGSGGKGKGH